MGTSSAIMSALTSAAGTGTNGTATSSTTSNSGTNLASNFNTFLNLLTTQLENQDPTNPVDSNQFTQQLVEFSGVQQQVQTNTLLQQILATSQANQLSSASSFVGSTIEATGNQGALSSGNANFGYTLPTAAASATVTITNSSGQVVYTGQGATAAGNDIVQWNGTNSVTGATEPAGTYSISVKAADANGNAITATPFIIGTVTSASISNGSVVLNLTGGLQVPESSVTSTTTLQSTSTGTNTSGSSS